MLFSKPRRTHAAFQLKILPCSREKQLGKKKRFFNVPQVRISKIGECEIYGFKCTLIKKKDRIKQMCMYFQSTFYHPKIKYLTVSIYFCIFQSFPFICKY